MKRKEKNMNTTRRIAKLFSLSLALLLALLDVVAGRRSDVRVPEATPAAG